MRSKRATPGAVGKLEQMSEDGVNVKQAVPFFRVANLPSSLKFYVDGLGFEKTKEWVHEGRLRWCWLECGGAAIMLQEKWQEGQDSKETMGRPGVGVSVCLMCEDALSVYESARLKGVLAEPPFVGNGLWVVAFSDPDGYRIEFESPTDVREGTRYEDRPGEN